MLAPFPDKDDIGILVVCFVLKCPFVMFKTPLPSLEVVKEMASPKLLFHNNGFIKLVFVSL